MNKLNNIHLIVLILFLNSCGGGGSASFSLTLPTNNLINIDEDNIHQLTISH